MKNGGGTRHSTESHRNAPLKEHRIDTPIYHKNITSMYILLLLQHLYIILTLLDG